MSATREAHHETMPTAQSVVFYPPAVLPAPTWRGADGSVLSLRPVHPADAERMRAFIEGLSFSARYFRFGCGEPHFSDAEFRHLCNPDTSVCADFIVVRRKDGRQAAVASARYCMQPDGKSCEFAIAVADDWQGCGLGRQLMQALLTSARRNGLVLIYGKILATNGRMLEFARRSGFDVLTDADNPAIRTVTRSLEADCPHQLLPHAAPNI